ncbi:hypothetical protein CRN84_16780 [Budvicia aquatica]|uniref:Tyr recombinase domain-containing protein n=2 Tax=Budvicia aquatica TaxID=82979 RepID=A0A2C6DRC8_9GAMM|nr:hypothetical protein CRN84_16780 [Budvicia aquatica]
MTPFARRFASGPKRWYKMGIMNYIKPDRHGTYYARLIVPKPLRQIIGKNELKKSLRTKDWREANDLGPEVLIELKNQFKAAELDASITLLDINHAVKLWKDSQLAHLDDDEILARYVRKEIETDSNGNAIEVTVSNADIHELCLERSQTLREYQISPESAVKHPPRIKLKDDDVLICFLDPVIKEALNLSGLKLLKDSNHYSKLVMELNRAFYQVTKAAYKNAIQNESNLYSGLPKMAFVVPNAPTTTTDSKSLSALFKDYEAAMLRRGKETPSSALKEYRVAIERFIELLGDLDIQLITKKHVSEFKTKLEQLPARPKSNVTKLPLTQQIAYARQHDLPVLTASTVKKLIRGFSAVCSYAIESGLIESNPAEKIKFQAVRRTLVTIATTKNFIPSEIETIFSNPLFTHKTAPERADYGDAHYWLPLILYYTGARVEEIAQLYVSDIRQDDNIWHIRITDESDDQSVKNDNSHREVPIHQHLIDLGLLTYRDSLPNNGRLFPKLQKAKGKYHSAVGVWWGKYLRSKIGITRPAIKPYHAFRHTFITLCRDNNIREDVQNAITGHAQSDFSSQNVGREYGSFSLTMKKKEIDKIPRLNVSCPKHIASASKS